MREDSLVLCGCERGATGSVCECVRGATGSVWVCEGSYWFCVCV